MQSNSPSSQAPVTAAIPATAFTTSATTAETNGDISDMDTDSNVGALPTSASATPEPPPTLLHPSTQTSSSSDTAARSQSPAKRLKSEEPPDQSPVPRTLEEITDPMDEDTESLLQDVKRGVSVDMLDETAGSSEVLADTASATSSTAATSIASTPRPPVEEMTRIVYNAKLEHKMGEGAVWYIISGPWLNRFLAQDPDSGNVISKEDAEGELGPIDNSNLVDDSQLLKKKLDDSTSSSSPFRVPVSGEGDTDDELPISEELIPMKPGICGDDFEMLPEQVWDLLVSWYGLAQDSPIIKRRVVNTSEPGEVPNLQFEYYPPTFTVYKLRDPGSKEGLQHERSQSPKRVIAAKADGFQKFLKKVKKLAGVEPSRKVRLWRVLGNSVGEEAEPTPRGVKKASTEKVPGTFGKLIIDLQAFLDLQPGSERELVDLKDTSNDQNYNGSLRIGTAGLGAGGAIVVDEESSDGGWVSEKNVQSAARCGGQSLTAAQHGKTTAAQKKKATSRSSSPSSSSSKNSISKGSIMSRGRREGRPQGKCGLSNLGNTCYMNSALQCLRSVKELSRYFISDKYVRELNTENPLAHHGKVAKAYASLLKSIFSPTCPASFAPREFKSTIGRFGPSFQGYGQQDSQEFLAFLLDGLHEDLNRIQKKPYIEKPESTDEMVDDMEAIAKLASEHWDIYKKRNDSAVADLFGGLYQSTLVCPTCAKVSITFDPFMDLTLPLPVENVWSKEVYFFPKDDSRSKVLKIPVEMDKNGNIKSLKEYVGKKMGIDPRMIMASEVYKYRFFKHYEDTATVSDLIQHNDDAFLYELDDIPTNWPSTKSKKTKKPNYYGPSYRYDDEEEEPQPDAPETEKLLVPVFNKVFRENKYSRAAEGFAFPFYIVVNREEAKSIDAIMSKIVEKYQILTSRNLYEGVAQAEYEDNEEYEEADEGVEVREQKGRAAGDEEQGEEEEKDGFVDVSMKDAASVVESDIADETEKRPFKKTNKRRLPTGLQDLFTVKVTKKKCGESALITGWQSLEPASDIRDRLNSSLPPSPPPRKPSSLFHAVGNPGRRSPATSISDDGVDDSFEDAPEPDGDMMQDASDDDGDLGTSFGQSSSFSKTTYQGAFLPVSSTSFYGNSSGNSSKKTFKTPSRTPSPATIDENPLIRWGEGLICEWSEAGYDAIFGGNHDDDFRGRGTWNEIEFLHDQELVARRRLREDRKRKGIHLEDCLDEFAKNEILSEEDPWYCPRCKIHQRATKKFELWKCPDILVIHLKRFSSSRNFRDKIDVLIDCPVEGLDLSGRVGLKENDHGLIYDLIAVDNHYGGLGGGHYTAYAKNWVDDKWYYCDDSNVREVYDPDRVITPAAYLLFYRRRSSKPLGGAAYEQLLTVANGTPEESAEETAGSSRDTSPNRVGEGGPSGDRISITMNGESQRSSGGGVSGFYFNGAGVGNGNLWGRGMGSNATTVVGDDMPPAYSAATADDSEESGVEMASLLHDTVAPPPTEYISEDYTGPKDELPNDMQDESDVDVEMGGSSGGGGGVILPQVEEDGEPAEIRVDDEMGGSSSGGGGGAIFPQVEEDGEPAEIRVDDDEMGGSSGGGGGGAIFPQVEEDSEPAEIRVDDGMGGGGSGGGGGVIFPQVEEDSEPAEIRVDDGMGGGGSGGGGVIFPQVEEDGEPAEIRVDDEGTVAPASDQGA